MSRTTVRRLAISGVTALAIAAGAPTAPASASATPRTTVDCVNYLQFAGYADTPERRSACAFGARGSWWHIQFCTSRLIATGVPNGFASRACELAARP